MIELEDNLLSFLGNCLAIPQQHVLTLAVLKLVHDLIHLGVFNINSCAKLVPLFVTILHEDDPFSSAHDDTWRIGVRLLLRAKLLTVSSLHVLLDRAAHSSTLDSFRAAGSFSRGNSAGVFLALFCLANPCQS